MQSAVSRSLQVARLPKWSIWNCCSAFLLRIPSHAPPATGIRRKGLITSAAGMPSRKRTSMEAGVSAAPANQRSMTSTTKENLTDVRFDALPLSAETRRALDEVFGYATCTTVQAASLPVCASGVDVVCKAKTGTGKTLAFLIPAIEKLKRQPIARGKTAVLVVSPTRELAHQIAAEAEQLARFHNLHVQSVVGGTNQNTDIKRFTQRPPDILVGTPGRLIDHLESTQLATILGSLQTLVFDEADRLLDMGFKPSIDKMLSFLAPKASRQTVLFSATFPTNIKRLADAALRPGYELVDTVGEDATQTAEKVEQKVIVTSMVNQMSQTLAILQEHCREEPEHKVVVFCTTARLTGLYAELFQALGLSVLEMHSRKSQSHRTKVSDIFRNGKGLIMFSSDVSARGVDYPDVTLVVQVGIPSDKDQYVHRVGRTARAGKVGQAVLVLQDFESYFLRKLQGLPVTRIEAASPQALAPLQQRVQQGLTQLDHQSKAQAYQAWLGFYNTYKKDLRWTPEQLVQQANYFATTLGLSQPPAMDKRTVGKMGLKGVAGLVYQEGGQGGGNRASARGQGRGQAQGQGPARSQDVPPGYMPRWQQGSSAADSDHGYNAAYSSGSQQRVSSNGGSGRGQGGGGRGRRGGSAAGARRDRGY